MSDRLVEVWAAGPDGRGRCGSGWIVGRSGVLTCRHVLDEYLGGGEPVGSSGGQLQARQAGRSRPSDWVDATLAWCHPVLDVVLLQVTPTPAQIWLAMLGRPPRLAATGRHPVRCTTIGFPDAEVKSNGLRESDQAVGTLLVGGGARDRDRLVPFDLDGPVPDDSVLWRGISGAAVVDEHERIIAIVARARPDRQQRRLLVLLSEEYAADADFLAAASRVGFNAVLQGFNAPTWNSSVDPRSLTPAGTPDLVGQIDDLTVFGVHRAASSASRGTGLAYVQRQTDKKLDQILANVAQLGRRVVLLVGDSASGKSRTAAEAVRRNKELRARHLIVPQGQAGLTRLLDSGLPLDNHLLWLDDLDKYLSGGLDLDVLGRVYAQHPSVLCVATMRANQLDARQGGLADPAWAFLTDPSRVLEVRLEASLTDDELANVASISDDVALIHALEEGVGLGEWIVAGPELLKKLANATGSDAVLANTVISWFRTGLQQPLPVDETRRLWHAGLPKALASRFSRLPANKQKESFEKAVQWACKPVLDRDLYEQALVSQTAEGFRAHDYVVDHVSRDSDRGPVPDAIWRYALSILGSLPDSDQRWSKTWEVGGAAYKQGAKEHALTAMNALAARGSAEAAMNVGMVLGQLGRSEEAVVVFDKVTRFGGAPESALRELVAKALVNKGIHLGKLGRSQEALDVFDKVVTRFGEAPELVLRQQVATALQNKGVRLSGLDRLKDALMNFGEVVTRFGEASEPAMREQVANGLCNMGFALMQLERYEEAVGVFDELVTRVGEAPEPALRAQVASGLVNKGANLGRLGRSEEALLVFDEVVARFWEAPEPALREQVARALFNKGVTLITDLGRSEEALLVFDEVVTWFGDATEAEVVEQVACALFNKGATVGGLGRPEEAMMVFDEVVTRFGDATVPEVVEPVAKALVEKGRTLGAIGRSVEAVVVFDEVVSRFGDSIESALREPLARALVSKGAILGSLGRFEEAILVFGEVVTRFGDAPGPGLVEPVAKALVEKGRTLGAIGRSVEAVVVFDEVVSRFGDAIESALREQVARALFNKGDTLGGAGRSEEAVLVFGEVVSRFGDAPESVLGEQVAMSLVNKGVALDDLDRSEEAVMVFDEVMSRFGDSPESALREQVARALFNKGFTLGGIGRSEGAIVVFDQVLTRFGDASESVLGEQVAMSLVNKGVALDDLDRSEEAVVVFDEVVSRFGDSIEFTLREHVARALLSKGVDLGSLGRFEEAVLVFGEVVTRFEDAPEPGLRSSVAKALLMKAITLRELERSKEAIGVFAEVVTRFANAPEPGIRELVGLAVTVQLEIQGPVE